MASVTGTWKQVSSENYGALLDALGVSEEAKDAFVSANATFEFSCDGDNWVLKTTLKDKSQEDKFKLGEETDGTSIIGAPLKYTVTKDGDALVRISKLGDKEIKIRWTVEGGQLVSQYTLGDVVATLKSDKA